MFAIDKDYRRKMEGIYRGILAGAAPGEYDENALPSYTHSNRLMAWLFWKRIDVALRLLGDISGKSVLDFGCGGAVTFKYLDQMHSRIVGCDENIALAKQVCEALDINAGLCQDLFKISETKFNFILALDVLEHIENSSALLDKFRSLLHANGKIILSGPTENFWYQVGRKLAGFSGHYHVKNIYQIEQEFAAHGFISERVHTLYHPVPLFRISRWAA